MADTFINLAGRLVDGATPANGDVLTWDAVIKAWLPKPASGGGGVTGSPNALVYINPAGTAGVTDPNLTAAPIDTFGRPQIWDKRVAVGIGAVYRQGQWQSDGDPGNLEGQGFVVYGPGPSGNPMGAGDGGYARIKSSRFGIAAVTPGVWTAAPPGAGLYYCFRADHSGIFLRPDTPGPNEPAKSFNVDRTTGKVDIGSDAATNPASAILAAGSTTRGFLPPRMTAAQRAAIVAPAIGLMVYQIDAIGSPEGIYVFKSGGWTFVA